MVLALFVIPLEFDYDSGSSMHYFAWWGLKLLQTQLVVEGELADVGLLYFSYGNYQVIKSFQHLSLLDLQIFRYRQLLKSVDLSLMVLLLFISHYFAIIKAIPHYLKVCEFRSFLICLREYESIMYFHCLTITMCYLQEQNPY